MRFSTLPFLLFPPALLLSQTLPSSHGVDLGAINKTADPCSDFYQYACGTWIAKNPIPPDQSRWSRFNELLDRNQAALREILEKAADPNNPNRDAVDRQIGEFYASCMDARTIASRGIEPLQPELTRIAKLSGKEDVAGEVAHLHRRGVGVFFRFTSAQDRKDATQVIANLSQNGLGLPDREYYLKSDPKSVALRNGYQQHVARMLTLLGHSPEHADAEAQAVLRIETSLAQNSLDRVSLRDPNRTYHPGPVSDLDKLAPLFLWKVYLADVGVPPVSRLNIGMPEFVKGMNDVISTTGLDDLKAYLTWHLLHKAAAPESGRSAGGSGMLPQSFEDENFAFFGKTLTGAQQMRPRWKQCVSLTDNTLGEALGRKFVEKTFGEQGKERTLRMVGEIEKQMIKDINSLTWMSAATKDQALTKLHTVANKIGYPENWRDYSSVKLTRADGFGNVVRLDEFEVQRNFNKIGKPVDKQEWGMTPPTVNAYYSPAQNNINFPAGILQPPFYDGKADDAVNYGAIGAVVGHELTHGFDDQGRQYDASGNVRDWWTANDASEFKSRADCLVDEYGNFSPVADVKLNGRLTLGENGADNGGLRLAYMALMDSLAGKPKTSVDGYTPEQRFFLGFGQIWCSNTTDEAARLSAATDPHSPGRFRVNGTLQNMPEFGQAFGCKVGQPMVKERTCRVW